MYILFVVLKGHYVNVKPCFANYLTISENNYATLISSHDFVVLIIENKYIYTAKYTFCRKG